MAWCCASTKPLPKLMIPLFHPSAQPVDLWTFRPTEGMMWPWTWKENKKKSSQLNGISQWLSHLDFVIEFRTLACSKLKTLVTISYDTFLGAVLLILVAEQFRWMDVAWWKSVKRDMNHFFRGSELMPKRLTRDELMPQWVVTATRLWWTRVWVYTAVRLPQWWPSRRACETSTRSINSRHSLPKHPANGSL